MEFSFFSGKRKKEAKAFELFNMGVALSLKAEDEFRNGNDEQAHQFNKEAIEKFRETLDMDTTHQAARSALGHCLYLDRQFREAIYWFDLANRLDGELPVNYREMGLCRINIGQIPDGKKDIDQAFRMDTSEEIRRITVQDLADTGELAFQYADGYLQQGETEKGKNYRRFAIGVLMLAFEYDHSRRDIALLISEMAEKSGDHETSAIYKSLSGK